MKDTPQKNFWTWFVRRESDFFALEPMDEVGREKLFDELSSKLCKINLDLAFEFGPKAAKRQFVISAGGIKKTFPAVTSLVAAAPPLARWEVVGFRPRRELNLIELNGKRFDPADVRFTLLDNGKMAGIRLFLPGFAEDDVTMKQIGYLLLDDALGEYDVATQLGLIQMLSPDAATEGDRYPLTELPELFDRLVARLRKSSAAMS